MIIEKLNCDFLKLSIFSYEEGYNTQALKELQITGIANAGTAITKNIDLTIAKTEWKLTFTGNANMTVKQVNVRNVLTNQLYPLLITPVALTNGNLQTVVTRMLAVFHSTFYQDQVTVTASMVGSAVTMTVDNLPFGLIMDSMVLTYLSVDSSKYFTFTESDFFILNGDQIFLKPSFFNLSSFEDGIYNITAIVTTTDDIAIQEVACYFMDCTMAAKLQAYADGQECDPHKMHLLLMHYTLTQASNNACVCTSMYDIFTYLVNSLGNLTNEDCGCK